MAWTVEGEIIEWRGPAPFLFLPMTEEDSDDLKAAARGLIYWGQVPVVARIGETEFETALFPKDGRYLIPLKAAVRRVAGVDEGDTITVILAIPGVC